MTLLETMAIIYAISIPVSFFICRWMVSYFYDELTEYSSPYEPMYLFKIGSFIPVMNTIIVISTLSLFVNYLLFGRGTEEDEDEEDTVDVDDLKP